MPRPVLTAILMLLVAVCAGCRPKPPEQPMTAEAIAERYGIITGKVAEMIASGEAARLIQEGKAEKHEYVLGRRPLIVLVTEYLVMGEPYRITTEEHRYFNPIPDVDEDAVQRIRYGATEDETALELTARPEIKAVLKCLRGESYEKKAQDICNRSYIDHTGTLRRSELRRKPAYMTHGCSTGIYILTDEKKAICLSGHATNGWFDRFDLQGAHRLYNESIAALLGKIAAKHGCKLRNQLGA